jgi:hypothetical protein
MKKLIWLLMVISFLVGCQLHPKQYQPNLEREIVGLQDIPLTNMPGHAPPECPLECLCPNWFGLDKSPCEKAPCVVTDMPDEPEVVHWFVDFWGAMAVAGDENKLMLIVLADMDDKLSEDLLIELAGKIDKNPCVVKEINKHYVPVVVPRGLYEALRSTGDLAWLPGDFVQSPAIMFAQVRKKGDRYLGKALPITFEGRINADLCTTLRAFHEVTR